MTNIKNYLSLVKFSHTLFAMPFALIGFFLAVTHHNYPFSWLLLLQVVLCMVFARNAAMAFNRYLDRDIDAKNARTASREVPAGIIPATRALVFVIVNALLFMLTTWFMNRLVFFLSPIALFVILFYSYTKRFTALCHFVLGLGLSLAPIGAYLSVTGQFAWLPILFSLVVLSWTAGFDIIYALQDEQFDRQHRLNSVPARLGSKLALQLSNGIHLFTAALLVIAGLIGSFGLVFWIGTLIFIGLLFYQHQLVKPNKLDRVNMAFATVNGLASVQFAVFAIADLLFF